MIAGAMFDDVSVNRILVQPKTEKRLVVFEDISL